MGQLSTHVLDTTSGKPGSGIEVTVFRVEGDQRERLTWTITNADGRCDEPLLGGAAFKAGEYELHFAVGDYLERTMSRESETAADAPRFLDTVVIRFGVSASDEHYHVPLLVSPFAYSTYRGS